MSVKLPWNQTIDILSDLPLNNMSVDAATNSMSLESDGHATSRRKALKVAVAALCSEVGFGTAEDSALETITEMLQAYIFEVGRSTRALTELSGRTESMVSDVILTLIEMGLDITGIPAHAKRANKTVFIPPAPCTLTPQARTLQVGEKRSHPSHIPDYLPPFPDSHTYIKTDAFRQPFNEYQLIREKAATQKRDVERALTRFIAKTGETQSLFKDDISTFPLIAVKPTALPYIDALLPKDQDLDAQDTESHHAATPSMSDNRRTGQVSSSTLTATAGISETLVNSMHSADPSDLLQSQDSSDADAIDNPYLRDVRIPKKRRK